MASIKVAMVEEKEEKRRRQLESRGSRQQSRDSSRSHHPHVTLTAEDLLLDDDEYRDSPDMFVDDVTSTQTSTTSGYHGVRGGSVRRRLLGTSNDQQQVGLVRTRKQPSPSDDALTSSELSLYGGTVGLKQRLKDRRRRLQETDLQAPVTDTYVTSASIAEVQSVDSKPERLKGILKNNLMGRPGVTWSELEGGTVPGQTDGSGLLPAIARSNTQIGFVKPDPNAGLPPSTPIHNIQTLGVSQRTREYTLDHAPVPNAVYAPASASDVSKTPKAVRFKEEDELFRLPELPSASASTIASESEDTYVAPNHPRMVRALFESEGYFIGKYA